MPREWSRGPQFSSAEKRKTWAPVIRSAQEAWATVELVSVSAGLRPSAWVFLSPDELPRASRDSAGQGLAVTPVSWSGQQYRVAVSAPSLSAHWHRAADEGNDELIGQLLGFPACCRASFQKVWIEQRARDQAPYCSAFEGPWETNILLRHIGVRAVPHLPCAGSCSESLAFAQSLLKAGSEAGADVESIERLLRLPVSYSAVNGVAIVDCGPFRFMHGTDAAGNFARAAQARPDDTPTGVPSWTDNGFETKAAMDAAHDVVLQAAAQHAPGTWLDLGAGDGALLARLGGGVAVEMDAERAARGSQRHPGITFLPTTIENALRELAVGKFKRFDAALLMPGRVLELPETERAEFLAHVRRVAGRVLVYAYGDWISRYHGLAPLAEAAGLRLLTQPVVGANGAAQAAWAEVI